MKEIQNCRKQFSRDRLDSPLKHMKSGSTLTMMQLLQKDVCILSWIYSGKNAYVLCSQPSKWTMHISTPQKSHFASVKKAFLEKCKNQKCRTVHGEKRPCEDDGRDVNRLWPLWRSVWCFLKHLRNRATDHTAHTLRGVYIRKNKNRHDTGTPSFRATRLIRTSTRVHLKYASKEKNG